MYTDYSIDNYITIDRVQVTACGEFSKYQVGDIITDTNYPLNSGDQINVRGSLINLSYTNLYSSTYDINYICEYADTRSTDFGVISYYNFPFPLTTQIHNYVDSVTAKVTLLKRDMESREVIVMVTDFHVIANSSPN